MDSKKVSVIFGEAPSLLRHSTDTKPTHTVLRSVEDEILTEKARQKFPGKGRNFAAESLTGELMHKRSLVSRIKDLFAGARTPVQLSKKEKYLKAYGRFQNKDSDLIYREGQRGPEFNEPSTRDWSVDWLLKRLRFEQISSHYWNFSSMDFKKENGIWMVRTRGERGVRTKTMMIWEEATEEMVGVLDRARAFYLDKGLDDITS